MEIADEPSDRHIDATEAVALCCGSDGVNER
jgi:hypothetical protein